MKPKRISIKISSSIGKVSGISLIPDKASSILVLAHGAGAGMQHAFMEELSEKLADRNIGTVRFNFPYMEAGKKRPDSPAIAHQAVEAALLYTLKQTKNKLPVYLSGKSFGGRMSSQYLSEHADADARGIIFFGFPLHAPGDPGTDRAEHLKKIKHPMLFLSGTRDEFARLDLLQKVCKKLPTATLVKIENANHGFKAPGKKDVISFLAEQTENWIEKFDR